MLRNIADDPEGAWKAKILREARKVFPPQSPPLRKAALVALRAGRLPSAVPGSG
jgi:hypothetical protein